MRPESSCRTIAGRADHVLARESLRRFRTSAFCHEILHPITLARYGIGVDTIPLEVATSRGIQITNVPDYCIEEVADHGLALILAFTRGIIRGLDQTRGGGWNVKSLRPLHRQRGQILGLGGFGRIARALAHRARALGYEIIASDPFVSDDTVRH